MLVSLVYLRVLVFSVFEVNYYCLLVCVDFDLFGVHCFLLLLNSSVVLCSVSNFISNLYPCRISCFDSCSVVASANSKLSLLSSSSSSSSLSLSLSLSCSCFG